MFTNVEYKEKIIVTKTHKQLSLSSLAFLVEDIKNYCDEEHLVMGSNDIPVSAEEIHRLLVYNENLSPLINCRRLTVWKLNPNYNPNYPEDEETGCNLKYEQFWHSRWEGDYEGVYETWSDNLVNIISNFIDKNKNNYNWDIVKIEEEERDY